MGWLTLNEKLAQAAEPPKRATAEEVEKAVAAGKLPVHARTRLCRNFTQAGECTKGVKCPYAHGPEEQRPEVVPTLYLDDPVPILSPVIILLISPIYQECYKPSEQTWKARFGNR